MKQLMVISHDTYASGLTPASSDIDDLASLAEGAYAILDKDPESGTYDKVVSIAASSEAQTPSKFQFVTMTANGLKFSPIISRAYATCVAQAYVAPVAKVMNVAWTASSLEAGQVAGFVVTDLSKPAHELTRNRFYTRDVTSSDTEATINAALIATVNADALRIVTASAGTDIVLTGTLAGRAFQVSPIGIMSDATITQTTAVVTGTGTAAQLAAYEDECEIEQGNANYPQYTSKYFSKVSEVNTTTPGTYDCYMIRYKTPNQRAGLHTEENPYQELVVALLVSLSDSGDGKSKEGMDNFDADLSPNITNE